MSLLDVEKFVFYRGILGCALNEIPEKLLHEVENASNLEIIETADGLNIPHSLIDIAANSLKTYNISDINIKGDYIIKPTFEAWRRVVFNGNNLHSGNLAACCTLVIQHPEGLTKRFIKSRIPNSDKNLCKWVKKLEEINVLRVETTEDDIELIKFNYDLIEKAGDPANKVAQVPKIPLATTFRMAKFEISDEMINKSIEVIKENPYGISLNGLRTFLNVSDSVLNALVEKFKVMEGFHVLENNNVPSKVMFTGSIKAQYIDAEMVNFLVDMCRTLQIIMLSEQPKELKKMKDTVGISDEKFMEILEDNGFKVIEIRYKYMNSDFVIFSPEVKETDRNLIDTFQKAKNKIAKYFKTKIRNIFFKNVYLTSFDNNYSPYLKERVMYFYKYIIEQMKSNNMYFLFDRHALLQMNFFTFIKSVPLRSELQFIDIIIRIAKKSKNAFKDITRKSLENLNPEEYERLNSECLEISKEYTLSEVIDALDGNAECKACLSARINVLEFERIMLSVVKYNIFESFADADWIYFERIEGIEKYIDRVLLEIKDESLDQQPPNIPYPVRKRFFDQICEFSPDEFYQKTRSIIETTFTGSYKEFFMKKLQSFE